MSIHRLILGVAAAASIGAGAIHAQDQQAPAGQAQPAQQQASAAEAVTFNGCIYRASDEASAFALERTADADTTGTQASTATRGAASAIPGAVGTSGTAPADPRMNVAGSWYRLTNPGSENLSDFVGKAVRVTGSVAPGRDDKGTDVVIHRFEPNKTTVTVMDLKPAPQLTVQSITPVEGQCRQAK